MRKTLVFLALLLLAVGGLLGYRAYQMVQSPNVAGEESIEIQLHQDSNLDDLLRILSDQEALKSVATFERVAGWMKFGESIRPGHYVLTPTMSNRQIINRLRSGSQTPVTLTINSARMLSDVAGKMAGQIQSDSIILLSALTSEQATEIFSTTPENIMSYLIPNTYEVFWDISPFALLARLKQEHSAFWDRNDRREQAEKLGMTPEEGVYIGFYCREGNHQIR